MIEYLKKKKSTIAKVILLTVLLSIILAWSISALMYIPMPSPWGKTEWSGFLGSYIGGIATLLAVILTISYNNFEQNEKEDAEKREKLKKYALIVYYDFQFAFDELKKLYHEYLAMKKEYPCISDKDIMDVKKKEITQVYLDPNWIHNVAEIRELSKYCESEKLQDSEIAEIYGIYGNIATIDRWLTGLDYGDNVRLALMCIVESVDNKVEVKQRNSDLLEKIRKMASIPAIRANKSK